MKKYYATLILLTTIATSKAQPLLTGGTMPPVGYTRNLSTGTAAAPNATGGANITWDYSTAAITQVGTMTVIDPSTGPFVASFPATNYAFTLDITGGQQYFFYYASSAAKFENLASNVTSTSVGGNTYTNGRSAIDFPIAYLGMTTDTYQKTGSGTVNTTTNTYDGYGTLKTPFGTYADVVRIKQTNTAFPNPDYMWYQTNPLFMIFSYASENNSYVSFDGGPTNVNGLSPDEFSVVVMPNPATGMATISLKSNSVKDATLIITSSIGQTVLRTPIQGSITSFDATNWARGLYFYQVKTTSGKVAAGSLVVQ